MPRSLEVDRFRAKSADGSYETEVVITQDFINAASLDDPQGVLPGMMRARTIDGQACNRVDDDHYRVLGNDVIVERVRP